MVRTIQLTIPLLLALMLSTTLCWGQTSVLNQKVSIVAKDLALKKVLKKLNKEAKVEFSYSDNFVPVNQKISLDYKDTELNIVMDDITAQTNLNYQVVNGKVVLTRKTKSETASGTVTVSGYVIDDEGGEKLLGAHVSDPKNTFGVTTNNYGFYSLKVPKGEVLLGFTYVGYRPVLAHLNLTSDTVLNVYMKSSLLLDELEVEEDATYDIIEDPGMSTVELTIEEIENLPALAGEVDVFKAMHQVPGVKFGDENTVNLYVRGGDADQNLILMDGVPLYNTYHLFGFVSIINADAVNSVKLIKGGYPARYGGRLSSVLDVRMREGNSKKLAGQASIGLLTAQFTVEGPIKKDKTNFLFSARRTYPDLVATPIIQGSNQRQGIDGNWSMNFYDIHAKLNHKFSEKDRLFLSFYRSQDRGLDRRTQQITITGTGANYVWEDEINVDWSSMTGSVRWNHIWGKQMFSNLSLWSSDYEFKLQQTYKYQQSIPNQPAAGFKYFVDYYSSIRDYAGAWQFSYFPNPDHKINYGVNFTYHDFKPGIYAFDQVRVNVDDELDSTNIDAREYSLYFEDDFKVGKKFRANLGVHAALFNVRGNNYTSFQPRASARYLVNKHFSLKASYSEMTQFLHLLTTVGSGFPTDLWVPPTDQLKPQQSQQVAVGGAYFFKRDIELTVEGYYREMQNLIAFEDQANFLVLGETWEDKVTIGEGSSRGLEFFLKKNSGKTSGWISYTLSKTDRRYDEIAEGKTIPFRYDRTHDGSINIVHRFSDKLIASANWVYATGAAITLPSGEYQPLQPNGSNLFLSSVYIYGERNSSRLPNYHRLDVAVSFVKQKKRAERTFSVSIYNRRNPFYYYIAGDTNGQKYIEGLNLFPIIPSFRYSVKF